MSSKEGASKEPETAFATLRTTFRVVNFRVAPTPVPAPGGFGVVQGGSWHHHPLPEFQKKMIPGVPPDAFTIVGALEADASVTIVTENREWNKFEKYLSKAKVLAIEPTDSGALRLKLHWKGWRPQVVLVQPATENE